MRQSNLNAYNWFVANVGKSIAPDALVKILGTSTPTSGGGASGHVSHLVNVNGLKITSERLGRNVIGYTLAEKPKSVPTEVQEHMDRVARIAAKKNAPKPTKEQRAEARNQKKLEAEAAAKKAARSEAAKKAAAKRKNAAKKNAKNVAGNAPKEMATA